MICSGLKRCFITLCAILVAGPAMAEASLMECDGPAGVADVVEPWEQSTRTFANGLIRIVHVDTGGEPACCSSHMVILAPDPNDELGLRGCRILSDGQKFTGFQSVDVPGVASSYDAALGLRLSVPVERYIDGIQSSKATVHVRINQATGVISLER